VVDACPACGTISVPALTSTTLIEPAGLPISGRKRAGKSASRGQSVLKTTCLTCRRYTKTFLVKQARQRTSEVVKAGLGVVDPPSVGVEKKTRKGRRKGSGLAAMLENSNNDSKIASRPSLSFFDVMKR